MLALARLTVEASIAAAYARSDYAETRPRGAIVEIIKPKSINFATLSQKAVGPVRDAVQELIEGIIDATAEQLLAATA